jgi:CheY-like chemotaxis protein
MAIVHKRTDRMFAVLFCLQWVFAVACAVADMRMPRMNGIQFIKQARSRAPDTVYICKCNGRTAIVA